MAAMAGSGPAPRVTRASMALTTASASAARPWLSSQRGLSGRKERIAPIRSANGAVSASVQRQPRVGRKMRAQTGESAIPKAKKPIISPLNRPRRREGQSSAR